MERGGKGILFAAQPDIPEGACPPQTQIQVDLVRIQVDGTVRLV